MNEININSSDLSIKGYSNLAVLAGDDKISAPEIAAVPAAVPELEELLQKLSQDANHLQGVSHANLQAFYDTVKSQASPPPTAPAVSPPAAASATTLAVAPTNVPPEIVASATSARAAVKSAFKDPGDSGYKEYLSVIRRALAKLPGLEPSAQHDIADAIYQSRTFNLNFIAWLEGEAAKNTNSFDTSAAGSGTFPFWGEVTTFASVEEKRKVINTMLKDLANALNKPEVQAGMIESFLGEDFIKNALITVGGVAAAGVIGAVIVWKAGKWVLVKTLGTAGAAIAGAISAGAKRGWGGVTGTVTTAAQGDGFKGRAARAAAGAATGLVIDITTGMPGVATTAGGVAGAVRGKPILGGTPAAAPGSAPAVAPASGPSAVPYRELDLTKNAEKAVHNGIIEEIYKAQNSGISPTPDQARALSDSIKNGIASPNEIAEYRTRVGRYLALPLPPLGDPKKVAAYNAQVERIINGEKDPSKWNLKAQAAVKGAVPANEAAYRARLTTVVNDARSEKVVVGGVERDVRVGTKTPIEEIQNISDQIEEKKAELEKLRTAEAKLIQRLLLEDEYGKLKLREGQLPGLIGSAEKALEGAEKVRDAHDTRFMKKGKDGKSYLDTALRDVDSKYLQDKKLAEKSRAYYEQLLTEKNTALPNKLQEIQTKLQGITGKPASNIPRLGSKSVRVLTFDPTTGGIIDSTTLQKLGNDPVAAVGSTSAIPGTGVRGAMATLNGEIVALEKRVNPNLATLSAMDPKVPTTWDNKGINIGTERVKTLPALVEALAKLMVKR